MCQSQAKENGMKISVNWEIVDSILQLQIGMAESKVSTVKSHVQTLCKTQANINGEGCVRKCIQPKPIPNQYAIICTLGSFNIFQHWTKTTESLKSVTFKIPRS